MPKRQVRGKCEYPLLKVGKNKGDMFVKQYPDPETRHYDINSLPVRNFDGMITVTVFLTAEETADNPDAALPGQHICGPAKCVYSVWPDGKIDLLVFDVETGEVRE